MKKTALIFAAKVVVVGGDLCTSLHGLQCYGDDIKDAGRVSTHMECCNLCMNTPGCAAWTWNWHSDGQCWVKHGCTDKRYVYGYHSGMGAGPGPTPAPPAPCPTDWIAQIERSQGGKFTLNAGIYCIDRQYQLPPNTEIIGAGAEQGGTLIQAIGDKQRSSICNDGIKNRIGFLLGDNTYIGHLRFQGIDKLRFCDNQLLCGGAPFETPGCGSAGEWGSPPSCGHRTGIGHGIKNATVDDIIIEPNTVQNAVFVAPTPSGADVSQDITIRNVRTNGTWADGMNFHGDHKNILVDGCDIRNCGDDVYAIWSIGNGADNIHFRNSRAENPWFRRGCQSSIGYRNSNYCFAVYGGKTSSFQNVECYGAAAVVAYGNSQHKLYGGAWDYGGASSVRGVHGNVWNTCYKGVAPPFNIACNRDDMNVSFTPLLV